MMDRIKCQKGYTLILVMVCLSLFTITIIYMLETSLMERLISRNSRDAEQAFQLAEGAVYMGAEQVYQVISRDYRTVEKLPATIQLQESDFYDSVEGRTLKMRITNPRLIEQHNDYCLYVFTGEGQCSPAESRLKAQVRFDYVQYYAIEYGEDGSEIDRVFTHREFMHRGNIIRMEKELEG